MEESTCHCIVCKAIADGKITVIEDNEEDREIEGNETAPLIRMRMRLKKQQQEDILEEVNNRFFEVNKKHQELLKIVQQFEAEKLRADKRLEDENQNWRKRYVELEEIKLTNENKLIEAENKNQELLKNFEDLNNDREMVQIEAKNQQLLSIVEELKTAQLVKGKKLADLESKNQSLLQDLEELKAAKLELEKQLNQKNENLENFERIHLVINILIFFSY